MVVVAVVVMVVLVLKVAIPFALANMIGGYLAPGYVLKYGYALLRPMFLVVAAIMITVQIVSYLN